MPYANRADDASEPKKNKTLTPKQLELVAGKSREELLLATAPHIDPESPAFKADLKKIEKIEMAGAAEAVLGSGFAFREEASSDDFDWHTDDSIILKEQPATAVYFNKGGNLVIRQKGDWNDDGDRFLFVTPENFNLFADGVAARIRDGG